MNGGLLIKASMRSADLGFLSDQIARLEAGGIDGLHFDVMDGYFGHEISMGPMFVRGLRKHAKRPFDVHLWVREPERCLDSYIDAGADWLIVHVEACRDPTRALTHIRERGIKSGLAINPGTPPAALEPLLELCDEINVMTIGPDKPGELNEQGVENLRQVATLAASRPRGPVIQADGAVSSKTRDLFVGAGAQALVVGYPIFSRTDFGAAITELRLGLQPVDQKVR
jgi:ribulose-phosphate 3-epimerase